MGAAPEPLDARDIGTPGAPQLAEADFNPVLATPDRVSVLDARVRLVPRDAQDAYLRRLR